MLKVDEISAVEAAALDPEVLLDKFNEYGYVVVRGLLDPQADLQAVIEEYAGLLDDLARQWRRAGELSSDFGNLPFFDRLCAVVAETGPRVYDHFRIFFNPPNWTTADSPIHSGPAVFRLLTHPKILDVLEYFIGPEIYSNPVNVIRVKVPERVLAAANQKNPQRFHIGLAASWWHQDQGVFADDIVGVDLITVWTGLTDSTREMGCLQVVPGSHKQGLSVHCSNPDQRRVGIPEMLLGNIRHYVEMKAGDVYFMHRLTQHGSLPNLSDRVRFSFDLRYQPTHQGVHFYSGVPGFVARSRSNPATELRDAIAWRQLQEETRRQLITTDWTRHPPQNQFSSDHSYCI